MAKKILIIEDEEIILGLLRKKLASEGYDVYTAKDGEAGLAKVREIEPDLVLLDVIMPKLGGFEVMEEIQKDKAITKTPVIIISNSGQPVEIDRAKKLGAKDWLVKTEFDLEEVVGKVAKQLD